MHPIAQITASLETLFAGLDADFIARQQAWAAGRKVALREFRESAEYDAIRAKRCQWTLYARYFEIAGGKTWFRVINDRGAADLADFVEKNCRAIIAKRNNGIAAKLAKAGITEVLGTELSRTDDGFNGYFRVQTSDGLRLVTVDTILAGGYHIQCLHQRTLVRVR